MDMSNNFFYFFSFSIKVQLSVLTNVLKLVIHLKCIDLYRSVYVMDMFLFYIQQNK